MAKTLVIVESPTKAKTISKFLGSKYSVTSSFGHVRDLPKSKMGIDIENNTFLPTYTIPKDKTAQVKELKAKAKTAEEVIFASDEDREGEAIAWHLAEIFDIPPEKAKRIVFHEITKRAIDEALQHPRHINQQLVDAQQTRRIVDRLVGYELSPLLWKKVARGLSAGRVQSVAVRLIVEREREIQAFIPVEYWTIDALFSESKQISEQPIKAKLHAINGTSLKKLDLPNQEQVEAIVADLKEVAYTISAITKKEAKRVPPPPFTTSTLQQNANQKFGYSSKQTMRLAQQLYEGIKVGDEGQVGLITYMRTDSMNLSDQFLQETTQFIKQTYGTDYTVDTFRRYKTKSKGAQEAHEAIRPTHPERTPETVAPYLTPQQLKLYTLIWKRAVATQMKEARMDKTSIDISAKKYTFRAAGQMVVFPGWLKLYPESIREETLPKLAEGQSLYCQELKPEQHFTEPPARYSDATLVKALEEHGIGRPSTYAPTISTIEARNYVERDDNKRLKPTDIAFLVNDLLVEHFPTIVDYSFTAKMEADLDDIAEGNKEWQPVVQEFYAPFHETIETKNEELTKEDVIEMRELGTDPKTGKPIYARVGRYGPFVQRGSKDDEEKPVFASLPKGMSVNEVTFEQALEYLSLPKVLGQDEEGRDIKVNIGRFGPYVQVGKTYYSLKQDDPYTLTLERAKEVIQEKKDAEAKSLIKEFPGTTIIVKVGRYGPYITDGTTNAKIPKDTEPESLDLETCQQLLEESAKKPKRKFVRRKKSS